MSESVSSLVVLPLAIALALTLWFEWQSSLGRFLRARAALHRGFSEFTGNGTLVAVLLMPEVLYAHGYSNLAFCFFFALIAPCVCLWVAGVSAADAARA